MNIQDIKKVCVIGAGSMGHQIAFSAALAGFKVSCMDISEEMLNKAQNFAYTYFPDRVAKGKLTQDQVDQAIHNCSFTQNLEDAARDADFVIESAVEKIEVKRKLFAELDKLTLPHTILATNSSFIVSSKIAGFTKRPEKVCNMHFFNPALMMKLVEVVQGPHTSTETAQISMD
ncbi:MAG: 3-hydroxyacyl-CoA dehydrogenase family protein, partial [Desulfosporosinus sp.]|nr:3-hydroxyacyl-CoA dehydrogenase family protein [Desulfosporosinus sp.]